MRLQFGVIIGFVVAAQLLSQGQLLQGYEPPGRLIDVGGRASESERQSRNGAAARLDLLSSNSVHITATGSGHEIHLYQPDLVVQTLVRAVLAVRNRVPLSRP